ncbi:MAG: hypothetical protein CL808_02830 [Citromicrobium sp.]|nr:hypothetical protein [Citromicrobium sp.]
MIRPLRFLLAQRRPQSAILPMDREDLVHRHRLRAARRPIARELRQRIAVAAGGGVLAFFLVIALGGMLGLVR